MNTPREALMVKFDIIKVVGGDQAEAICLFIVAWPVNGINKGSS